MSRSRRQAAHDQQVVGVDRSDGQVAASTTASMRPGAPAPRVPPEADPDVLDEINADATDNRDRLLADIELIDRLAEANFEGPGWEALRRELARYGLGILTAWIGSGEIFFQCRAKNCSVGTAPSYRSESDWKDLVNETLYIGLINFERDLKNGRWRPDGGAGLKTYFIGACVYAFPNPYRAWLKNQDRRCQELSETLVHVAAGPMPEDPESTVIARHSAKERLGRIPERTRTAGWMHVEGYTYAEIAEALGTTAKAVEHYFARARKRTSNGSTGDLDDQAF